MSVSRNEYVAISGYKFTLMSITPNGMNCGITKTVAHHDERITSPVSFLGEHPFLFFIINSKKITLLCSKTLEEMTIQCSTQLGDINDYCISASGRYVLINSNNQVNVFSAHINDNTVTLQLLYQMENVTNALNSQQFSSDECYISWGCHHTVLVTKARELAIVQSISLPESKKIINLSIAQIGEENELIILQKNCCELLRVCMAVNEQDTLDLNIATNNHRQTLSAFGAKFMTAKGLSKEDKMLMQERGGILISEDELITQYQSFDENDQKFSIFLKALFYRYCHFMNTVDWNSFKNSSYNGTSLAQRLVSQQRNDGDCQDYLVFLIEKHGLPIDLQDKEGNTALSLAAQKGQTMTCMCLLDHGADMSLVNKEKLTAFRMAATNGHVTTCQLFLDRGMDVDAEDLNFAHEEQTALLVASKYSQEAICELLLARGADINQTNKYAHSSLYLAIKNRHLSLCMLFINYNLNTRELGEALVAAASTSFTEVCQALLKKGADVNYAKEQRSTGCYTPLMMACMNGHIEICVLFLNSGADPEKESENGTPLSIAIENFGNEHDVVKLMKEKILLKQSSVQLMKAD